MTHTDHGTDGHAELELEITSYLMASGCPNIEAHVTATPGVHSVSLNRNSGIILVGYDPGQVTPDAIIEAVKHCGFVCQEGGPVHTVSHAGHEMKDEHAGHDTSMRADRRTRWPRRATRPTPCAISSLPPWC